jgi:squalene synthase HpnC
MSRSSSRTRSFPVPSAPADAAPADRVALAHCARLTRRHYENFPVASWLLPSRSRVAVQAIYAFARTADDFADEKEHEGHRLERLDEWGSMLDDCFRGVATHPVFVALRRAVEESDLPRQPFVDLLTAFRMDVTQSRYADEASLLEYCRLSANPIGRLLLRLFGYGGDEVEKQSDAICTALQLANHWQDVSIDLKKDRIYIPQDALRRFGVREEELWTGRATGAFRALMEDRVAGTRDLLATGRPLCDAVRGRFRWELRLTWLGGRRILERI